MKTTKISWADATFNPWWGCLEVSPACDGCYARVFANRIGLKIWGQAGVTDRRFFADKHWAEPEKWNRDAEKAGVRKRVFCASMADVFELNPELDVHRDRLWKLIEATPWLEWLLLTKRPQNIVKMVPAHWLVTPPDNVRYGTTAENQHYANLRTPTVLAVPHVLKPFLSVEPQLGMVNLMNDAEIRLGSVDAGNPTYWLVGRACWGEPDPVTSLRPRKIGPSIGWVVAGGESGKDARPTHPDWLRVLRDQCITAGVPFHMKQWGEWSPDGTGQIQITRSRYRFKTQSFLPDGTPYDPIKPDMYTMPGMATLYRRGNHDTGRLLDGVEHNGFPAPSFPASHAPVAAGA